MKPNLVTLLALSSALVLSGCSTTLLFHADFDADIVGAPPSSSPPGAPAGDIIRIWHADPGNLVVQPDKINMNSLAHSYQSSLSQADFISAEAPPDLPDFWAEWHGCAERFSSATPRFFFSVGNNTVGIANLEIVDGDFRASGERLADVVLDAVHLASIHVDNRAGTYEVHLFQTTPTAGDDRAVCALARPADCPRDWNFEEGQCHINAGFPTFAEAHCRLEDCGVCRADEFHDATNGTCVRRLPNEGSSRVAPLSNRGLVRGDARYSIHSSYDNVVANDPASYSLDDINIYAREP